MIRYLLSFVVILMFSIGVQAQAQKANPQESKGGQAAQRATSVEVRGNEKSPLIVKLLPTAQDEKKVEQEKTEREEKALLDRKLVELTADLAKFTYYLALFTFGLVAIALFQLFVFGYQSLQLKRTVDSSERASMPFLHPTVDNFKLHPPTDRLRTDITHLPSVRLGFMNIGKTPATIRQIAVQFLLVENDKLPANPSGIPVTSIVQSDAVVAADAFGGAREWQFGRTINAEEIQSLAHSGSGQFKRFFIYGHVIYDDFFDVRHTKHFCLKVRQNGFQAVRGGNSYNAVSREKAPKGDVANAVNEET